MLNRPQATALTVRSGQVSSRALERGEPGLCNLSPALSAAKSSCPSGKLRAVNSSSSPGARATRCTARTVSVHPATFVRYALTPAAAPAGWAGLSRAERTPRRPQPGTEAPQSPAILPTPHPPPVARAPARRAGSGGCAGAERAFGFPVRRWR